jgi:hypothetical protein
MAKLFTKLKAAKSVPRSKKMPEQPNQMVPHPSFKNSPEMKMDRAAHKVMGLGYKHKGGTSGSNPGC